MPEDLNLELESDARLSLNAAAKRAGIPRETLARLIAEPSGLVGEFFGAAGQPPTIPQSKVALLAAWGEQRETDPRLKPAALAQSLSDGADVEALLLGRAKGGGNTHRSPVNRSSVNGAELAAQGDALKALTPAARAAVEQIGVAIAERVASLAIAPMEDRLIGAEAVRELLGGSIPKALQPVVKSPARWKRSAVLRYIASL
jgi:hypothetical protein